MGAKQVCVLTTFSCLLTVNVPWFLITVPWVRLQFMLVAYPDQTHLLLGHIAAVNDKR